MKSLFDKAAYQEITSRLDRLTPSSQAQWGKMNVAQMLAHCAVPIGHQLGRHQVPKEGNFLVRLLFKSLLYNDKPFRRSLPTAKSFVIVDSREFQQEHDRLKSMVVEAHKLGLGHDWPEHPSFGKFTPQQAGQAMYKHLDHHLHQFGV